MHRIVGFDAPHLGLSLNTTKHERCLTIPGVILNKSKNGAASLSRRTSTPNPNRKRHRSDSSSHLSTCTMPRPQDLFRYGARSRRLIPFLLLAQRSEHASSSKRHQEENVFVSFKADRSEELSGRRTEEGALFVREHRPYLIARPFLSFVHPQRTEPLTARAKLQLLIPPSSSLQPNLLFSIPQKSFLFPSH